MTLPLAGRHLNWGAEALWQQLDPLLPGMSVEVVAHADSTNTRLLERARVHSGQRDAAVSRPADLQASDTAGRGSTPFGRRTADVQPCLLVAEHQTLGRGRLGRSWVSSPGTSLTFSLSLPLQPIDWSGLSLAVGLALAEALDPLAPGAAPRIAVKWPNDLWLVPDHAGAGPGRKLGGVLIETVSVGQHRMCVVGVGLNVLPQPVDETGAPVSPAPLAHGYGSLSELEPAIDAPAALARVAAPLVQALLSFQGAGFAPLVAAYTRRDALLGRPVTTTLAEVPDGVADGVDQRGALRVRRGALHHVISGEVSVRLQPAAMT
ncbi:MAG TPA: biotin--[acetyl-CoA-carboxylase] ligase [Rubrivivax sp.]|nr:biotin--[acetyl-CoA-carboxylase] ligase [Rubrivivax sp.]